MKLKWGAQAVRDYFDTFGQDVNRGPDSDYDLFLILRKVNVTVQGGYVPFQTMALISGSTLTSSGSGATQTFSLPLWELGTMNTQARPMLVRVPSKDKDQSIRVLDFILYKVQFQPFSFDGPSYKDGLLLNYSGKALMSNKDEKGTVLADRAIGRLVNSQRT